MTLIPIPDPFPEGLLLAIEAAGHGVSLSPDGLVVTAADAVQAIVDGYVGSAAELAHAQGRALAALGELYLGKIGAGLVYAVDGGDARPYQIDPASQTLIAGAAADAGLVAAGAPGALAWPDGFGWITADNAIVPMDAAQCFAFGQAVKAYVTGLVLNNRALKTAIGAAADVAAVQAIDLTQGWPTGA